MYKNLIFYKINLSKYNHITNRLKDFEMVDNPNCLVLVFQFLDYEDWNQTFRTNKLFNYVMKVVSHHLFNYKIFKPLKSKEWDFVPYEILLTIMDYVDLKDYKTIKKVSSFFYDVSKDSLNKRLELVDFRYRLYISKDNIYNDELDTLKTFIEWGHIITMIRINEKTQERVKECIKEYLPKMKEKLTNVSDTNQLRLDKITYYKLDGKTRRKWDKLDLETFLQ